MFMLVWQCFAGCEGVVLARNSVLHIYLVKKGDFFCRLIGKSFVGRGLAVDGFNGRGGFLCCFVWGAVSC